MSGLVSEEANPYIYVKLIGSQYLGEVLQEDEASSYPEDEAVGVEEATRGRRDRRR